MSETVRYHRDFAPKLPDGDRAQLGIEEVILPDPQTGKLRRARIIHEIVVKLLPEDVELYDSAPPATTTAPPGA